MIITPETVKIKIAFRTFVLTFCSLIIRNLTNVLNKERKTLKVFRRFVENVKNFNEQLAIAT